MEEYINLLKESIKNGSIKEGLHNPNCPEG